MSRRKKCLFSKIVCQLKSFDLVKSKLFCQNNLRCQDLVIAKVKLLTKSHYCRKNCVLAKKTKPIQATGLKRENDGSYQ